MTRCWADVTQLLYDLYMVLCVWCVSDADWCFFHGFLAFRTFLSTWITWHTNVAIHKHIVLLRRSTCLDYRGEQHALDVELNLFQNILKHTWYNIRMIAIGS